MKKTSTRTGVRLAASVAALAMLLASCSSSPEATPSASGSSSAPIASSSAPVPSSSASSAPLDATGLACAAYFQLDLLNSSYAGGAVANGNATEQQMRDDFTKLLKEMVAQGKAAAATGVADPKLLINAKRMKKMINSLAKGAALSDLSKSQQAKFAKQSVRVQKACERAGYPLPADNTTARTAAGL
jgi:hypothetical protein